MQSVSADVQRLGYFAKTSLVVVPSVTRENVEAAIAVIAERGFVDI